MGVIFNTVLVDVPVIFFVTLLIILGYIKWSFSYWKKQKVPHPKPTIPYGNTQSPVIRKLNFYQELGPHYWHYKSKGCRYFGYYRSAMPLFVPIDLELIKNIMTKDFDHFIDRGLYFNENNDPLSVHLFAVDESKWKYLRTKMTPTFTSGKMKMMFQTLLQCSDNIIPAIDEMQTESDAVDIKEILACFTTDVIASCAFGLEFNTIKNKDAPFRYYGKKMFQSDTLKRLRSFINTNFPRVAKMLNNRQISKDISDYFIGVVKDTVNYREVNNYHRKDFMELLIELRNSSKNSDKEFTIDEIAAQAFIFFLAGFETSSTAMTFCIYELCLHQDIQEKARKEIFEVLEKYDGNLTYDGIAEMNYLGQCLDETMRKYPPIPILTRKCVKDYKVPGSEVIIHKGVPVSIPVYWLHHDPEHFTDPECFDPERFNKENKPKIKSYSYMPFGEGPRNCIGLRFGTMQAKVGLAVLLKNYRFTLNPKTLLPLRIDPNVVILQTTSPMLITVEKM